MVAPTTTPFQAPPPSWLMYSVTRLMPKQFDRLVNNMREMMERVRVQERIIMKLSSVEQAKMPKKTFVLPSPTTNETALFGIPEAGWQGLVPRLLEMDEEILRSIGKLQQIEEETGLSIAQIKTSIIA